MEDESEQRHWSLTFVTPMGHVSTYDMIARTLPQAVVRACDDYCRDNGIPRSEGDRHLRSAESL